MRITPNQRFRDGTTTYDPGREYDVPAADGAYFVRCGWADSPDYAPPGVATPAPVTDLAPDSAKHTTTATEV